MTDSTNYRSAIHRQRLPLADLLAELYWQGYFPKLTKRYAGNLLSETDGIVTEAVAKYQSFHGLIKDGVVGEQTYTELAAPRCARPDFERGGGGLSMWPLSCIKIRAAQRISKVGKFGQVSAVDIDRAWLLACREISRHSVLGMVPWIGDWVEAKITATRESLGRNTLADSYTPNQDCSETITQRYNTSINWDFWLLVDTMVHELLHAIGVPHLPTGNIMQPTASGSFNGKMQAGDIREVVKRYGKPNPIDPIDPIDPPVGVIHYYDGEFTIKGRFTISDENGNPFSTI